MYSCSPLPLGEGPLSSLPLPERGAGGEGVTKHPLKPVELKQPAFVCSTIGMVVAPFYLWRTLGMEGPIKSREENPNPNWNKEVPYGDDGTRKT